MIRKNLLTAFKESLTGKTKVQELNPPTEVLWEVTPKCNKNCKFCGSKNLTKREPLDYQKLIKIATNIANAKNKPKEITLTGGEPGTLPFTTLYDVVTIFRRNKIKVKAVTNGSLISTIAENDTLLFDSFEAIGLSINNEEDISYAKTNYRITDTLDNITMITNFGTHNIFQFDKLKACADKFGAWQIQLTQGNEYQLPPDGIGLLWDKFKNSNVSIGNQMILADNAQPIHQCMAGVYGCSITYDGLVIPCLSMRTWMDPIHSYGNLLIQSFDTAWTKGLNEFRNLTCKKSCRDGIEYPMDKSGPNGTIVIPVIEKPWEDNKFPGSTVSMYAVATPRTGDKLPGQTIVYGVFNIGSGYDGSKPISDQKFVYGTFSKSKDC